jgi:hypothetical protein
MIKYLALGENPDAGSPELRIHKSKWQFRMYQSQHPVKFECSLTQCIPLNEIKSVARVKVVLPKSKSLKRTGFPPPKGGRGGSVDDADHDPQEDKLFQFEVYLKNEDLLIPPGDTLSHTIKIVSG